MTAFLDALAAGDLISWVVVGVVGFLALFVFFKILKLIGKVLFAVALLGCVLFTVSYFFPDSLGPVSQWIHTNLVETELTEK